MVAVIRNVSPRSGAYLVRAAMAHLRSAAGLVVPARSQQPL